MDIFSSLQSWLGITNTRTLGIVLIVLGLAFYGYCYYAGREKRRKEKEEDDRIFRR